MLIIHPHYRNMSLMDLLRAAIMGDTLAYDALCVRLWDCVVQTLTVELGLRLDDAENLAQDTLTILYLRIKRRAVALHSDAHVRGYARGIARKVAQHHRRRAALGARLTAFLAQCAKRGVPEADPVADHAAKREEEKRIRKVYSRCFDRRRSLSIRVKNCALVVRLWMGSQGVTALAERLVAVHPTPGTDPTDCRWLFVGTGPQASRRLARLCALGLCCVPLDRNRVFRCLEHAKDIMLRGWLRIRREKD